MLEYKCEWYGKELRVVDRFYPSSKTCSHCGHVVEEMPLDVRMFACPECGLEIDRDYNAAINICSRGTTAERTLMDAVTNPDEASMSFNNYLS
jgi:putative transposase